MAQVPLASFHLVVHPDNLEVTVFPIASSNKYLARISASSPNSLVGRSAAALMQRGDKLKDVKIAGKSFNERVKEKQKDYTKRGNLIEKALLNVGDAPVNPGAGASAAAIATYTAEKAVYDANVAQAKVDAAAGEKAYLGGKRFSYASTAAMKKAAKAAQGTDNKEALENLIAPTGKWSPQAHKDATERLEGTPAVPGGAPAVVGLNEQINRKHQTIAGLAATPANAAMINLYNGQLSSLIEQRKEAQEIIKGHLDTVGKLSNLESK